MMKIEKLITNILSGAVKKEMTAIYGRESLGMQQERWVRLLKIHRDNFSVDQAAVFSAPGRTEIGGNHTDHNLGKVLAAGVDLDTLGAATVRSDNLVCIHSEGYSPISIDLESLEKQDSENETPVSLIRGIARFLKERGYTIGGFDCSITSRVLPGSGLSSSASFEVLIGSVFNGLYNENKISLVLLAQAGQYGENEYYGKPSGLMDQMACALGGIVALDFKDPASPEIHQVHIDFSEQGLALMITDTRGDHADLSAAYARIPVEMKSVAGFFGKDACRFISMEELIAESAAVRESCGDRAFLRAYHFLKENDRVDGQLFALEEGDMKRFTSLVNESGRSSFQYLQNISVPSENGPQNMGVALAMAENFLKGRGASRVHGGGFEGTILAFVPRDLKNEYTVFMNGIFGAGAVVEIAVRNPPAGMIVG